MTTEVNTVFQNLVAVLNQVDTPKLNAVLTALGDGLRGKGEALGEATTDLNEVLEAINPRSETIRADFRALKGFSDTYSSAAHDIVTVLDAASTTSATVSNNAQALDSLLLNVVGLSHSGIGLIGPNKDNLVHGVNLLESTTRLLMKYNPELTCTLVGSKYDAEFFGDVSGGHNGYSVTLDVALLLGDEAYRYPDNLPINGAKGGPGDSPAAERYPTCPRTSRCATSSPTPGGGAAWTCDPTPASVSRIRRLPAGHPWNTAAAQPSPSGRDGTWSDSVPGCATVRSAAVRAGWNAAVSGVAARASAGTTARSRPAACGVGTVHAASAGGDPTDLRRPQPGVRTAATATKCPGAMTAHRVEKS